MSVSVQAGTALVLERFWKWLKEHTSCILRAGTPDCYLYDDEDLHWHLGEDGDRNLVVQVIRGKEVFAEIILVPRDVLFVQAAPDPETGEPDRYLFELIGGSREEPYPLYHFLMAHSFEDEGTQHGPLKH